MARTPRATTMTPAASCKRLLMLDDEELPGRHHGGHFQRSERNCPSHTGSCDSIVLSFTEGFVAAATAALLSYPSGTKSARLLKLEPSALHFTPTYPSQHTLPTPLRGGAFPSKYLLHQRQKASQAAGTKTTDRVQTIDRCHPTEHHRNTRPLHSSARFLSPATDRLASFLLRDRSKVRLPAAH